MHRMKKSKIKYDFASYNRKKPSVSLFNNTYYSKVKLNTSHNKRFKNIWINERHDTDRDGVPNYRDCMPFNPFYHVIDKKVQKELIKKAEKRFGITQDPHKAGYILPSGKYLDLSSDNLNKLYKDPNRHETTSDLQIAHWEIGKVTGITGRAAIRHFQKETGSIRFRKTRERGLYAEMVERPTPEQSKAITTAIRTPPEPTFMVFERVPETIKQTTGNQEKNYIETESSNPMLFQKFVSTAFNDDETDTDNDGVPDNKDCKPLDPNEQGPEHKKHHDFPIEKGNNIKISIIVPSTKDKSHHITKQQFKSRINEVSSFLSKIFGGTTNVTAYGTWVDNKDKGVSEDVVVVETYTNKKTWEANDLIVKKYIERKKMMWGQECIAFNWQDVSKSFPYEGLHFI